MARRLDRTTEFREAIASTSKAGGGASEHQQLGSVSSRAKGEPDEWLTTAQKTAQTLHALSVFLRGIRKAYLDVGGGMSSSSGRKAATRALDFSQGLLGVDTGEWKWMSDRERDEVDLQVKGILRASLAKIKELDKAETARQRQASKVSMWSSGSSPASETLKEHRKGILSILNNLLANTGNQQSSQQEARFQRNMDRRQQSTSTLSASFASQAGAGASTSNHQMKDLKPVISDDPPIDSLLSQQQMQQFDDEARQLTEAAQSQLSQIKSAETSLLEISALQSELVIHLSQQAETTSKLFEDSIYTSGKVTDANQQLQKARDRNRESRVWLLIFLIGASFTLLFLDQY